MPDRTPHRRLSAAAAVALAVREADRMGLRLRVTHSGPASHPTAVTEVVGAGETLVVGYGKGTGRQAVASAHFEALERYFTIARSNRRFADGAIIMRPATEVVAQEGLRQDLLVQRWGAEFPESTAACTRYDGRLSAVWYPLFLTDPLYHRQPLAGDSVDRYRSLIRYTSSLGTAAGADLPEAILHGVCELIEHDAVSHALLRWFVAGAQDVDLVRADSLPDSLRALWRKAEEAISAPVHLLDITTDLGVPAYLAVADGDGTAPSAAGAGASPMAGYAAERALSEVIQSMGFPRGATDPVVHLAAWPRLRDCAMLPVRRLLSRTIRRVPLRADLDGVDTVPSALARLERVLRKHGIESYHAELTPAESMVSVAAVLAPGLERFSLVRLGMPIVPTGRGGQVWTTARLARAGH
jgi:ribosomal protein S12 methylthiotransferase accessory factor